MTLARPASRSAARREWHWLMRAGFIPALALTALAFGQGAVAPAAGQTPPAGGTVSGYVFHDLDGDGLHDDAEPGLERLVQLVQNGVIIQEGGSEPDGSYSFAGVPPGDYELVTELDGAKSFCLTPVAPNFDPLYVAGCVGIIPQPWHPTTPEQYAVSVAGADSIRRDFGATPFDQSVLLGRAILEGDYAPPGTAIEALADGRTCGTGAVAGGAVPGGTYRIAILGAGEQTGCPMEGQAVTLRVGGLDALNTAVYTPQSSQTDFIFKPVAMLHHAWYWVQQIANQLPPTGIKVQALVNGKICGETELQTYLGASGFSKLVVADESVQMGCGYPGATIKFRLGGVDAITTALWEPGVHRLILELPAETRPTPTYAPSPAVTPTPAALPEAGGKPGGAERSHVAWWAAAIAAALVAAGLSWASGRRIFRVR